MYSCLYVGLSNVGKGQTTLMGSRVRCTEQLMLHWILRCWKCGLCRCREDAPYTFSPATSASLVRLIPILGLQQEHSLYSIDVKDAFLQVPQRNRTACEFPKEYVELFGDEDPQCRNDGFLLLRVLPGQRDAALLWSDHFASTLQEQQFSRCVACPTLFRDTKEQHSCCSC